MSELIVNDTSLISTNNNSPVIIIAGGADVSPSTNDLGSYIVQLLDKLKLLGFVNSLTLQIQKMWNISWKLDPLPNSIWISELKSYLKMKVGHKIDVVHINWSGSASPLHSRDAIDIFHRQIKNIAKKYPDRRIICICKSISGPYMLRAIHELQHITIDQFITLGSPWGICDSVPQNISQSVFITSKNDFFCKLGYWLRFGNITMKVPFSEIPKKTQSIKIVLELPTHGQLNHDTPIGSVYAGAGEKMKLVSKNYDTMYGLVGNLIDGGVQGIISESETDRSHRSSPLAQV